MKKVLLTRAKMDLDLWGKTANIALNYMGLI